MSNIRLKFAKQLRSNLTDAEKLLWYHLRGHRFNSAKFKRQQPLGNYIVDFVCFAVKLVIEVDGGQHVESVSDQQRDDWLRVQGFVVLRFWNNEVLGETEAVLEKILLYITPSPQPSPAGGEGVTHPSPQPSPAREEGVRRPSPQPSPAEGGGEYAAFLPNPSPTRGEGLAPSPLVGEGWGEGWVELQRVRWRARRGLLELDIVLGRFIEAHYATLDENEKAVFEALLDMPDNPLWDMIAGRQVEAHGEQQALLEKIRAI